MNKCRSLHQNAQRLKVRTHLQRLVDLEYAVIHSGNRGQCLMYELLYKGEGKKKETFFMGLIDINKLTTT
ncbi:hypothetical protein [Candidatus Uabimicrobium amorphum]|uniref:hypothetical protein n=1 Tax=Uabimicrobium amorphum TaxID=2596890 RepID=UPI00125EF004|nr:hypothetical protein [Candidatus Uabimicrobium amorphum]